MVGNLPARVRDVGLIPGWGTKIPLATSQLSPCTTITEPACPRAHALQQEKTAVRSPHAAPREQPHTLQLEKTCAQQPIAAHHSGDPVQPKKPEMF